VLLGNLMASKVVINDNLMCKINFKPSLSLNELTSHQIFVMTMTNPLDFIEN
jgi:hypothetical protein